jgi:hypothetical protein
MFLIPNPSVESLTPPSSSALSSYASIHLDVNFNLIGVTTIANIVHDFALGDSSDSLATLGNTFFHILYICQLSISFATHKARIKRGEVSVPMLELVRIHPRTDSYRRVEMENEKYIFMQKALPLYHLHIETTLPEHIKI